MNNNFKKLLASAMALAMVTSVVPAHVTNVQAATYVEEIDPSAWKSNESTTVTTDKDGNVIIGKGKGGAVNKSNVSKITADGVSVSTYVDLTGYTQGQLFSISLGINDDKGDYVTEFLVVTQKDGNNYVITSGLSSDTITLTEDGVYTYIWNVNKDAEGKLHAEFTVEDYGKEVGSIVVDNADFTNAKGVSLRYLWAFGRYVDGGYELDRDLKLFNELPVKNNESKTIEDAINNKSTVVELLDLLGDVTTVNRDEIVKDNKTFEEVLFEAEAMLNNAYKYASVVGYSEEQTDALKHLVGTKIENNTKNAVEHASDLVSKNVVNFLKGYDGKVDANVVKEYNKISALLAFKGNVHSSKEDVVAEIEDLFADLEADVKDYKEDNVESDAKKFAKALAEETVVPGFTVSSLVDDEAAISYTKRSGVESFIKKATKDSYTLAGVRYGDVKNEGVVEDYIEALNTIVDEMKEVKDLLDDTKAEKKAFDKLSGKLNELVNAINADDSDSDDYLDGIDSAIAAFRASDVKVLKDYVENVVNEFWTVATEQRTSGSYRVKTINAGLGRYYGFEEVAGKKLVTVMTTLVDADEEETYYDLLVADAASIDELLKAVTTDIEGLTMSSTITTKDASKIIAAKKALSKIDAGEKGKRIYDSLSRSERADVDANRDLIEALYVKLILNSDVVKDGWVDLGNGNWDYYKDGKAFTGWVCSAKDVWYYVSNGHMLRDAWVWRDNASAYYVGNDGIMVYGPTTVNGYELDANGLWHA